MQAEPAPHSRAVNFWAMLDESQRRVIRAASATRHFPPGVTIISTGSRSRWVLVLTSGRVKVVSFAAGGHEAVLAVRGPGDIIGELAALDGSPRSATVVAVDEVIALWLPADRFLRILRDHPAIGEVLLKIVAARLRYANSQRTEFGDRTTSARVASALVELADRYGTPGPEGVVIELRVSQHDLAGLVAASRAAVARALRVFRDDGLISTGRQRIVVHGIEALRQSAMVR